MIVAFVAGVLVGVAGDHLLFIHHLMAGRGGRFAASRIVDRLDHELHLTPQQRSQAQQIIDRHRVRIDAVMGNVRQEIDATNAEIEKILTPDQRTAFAKMRMRMPGRRGMGPPPRRQ